MRRSLVRALVAISLVLPSVIMLDVATLKAVAPAGCSAKCPSGSGCSCDGNDCTCADGSCGGTATCDCFGSNCHNRTQCAPCPK
jgi:hypothetical protein